MTRVLVRERRRFRAPAQDRGVFCDPPAASLAALAGENQARLADSHVEIQGRSLSSLAREARAELLREAFAYSSAYRSVRTPDPDGQVLLAGHQAELFHPGVWAKHFFLDRLARESTATAVNLVIDSDTWKTTSLWTPSGSAAAPVRTAVPFDRENGQANVPTEERHTVDPAQWASFGERLAAEIAPLVPDPLVREFWPRVLERTTAGELPGTAIAQARHQLEGAWGLETLELPISATCRFAAFPWFVACLAAQAPRWLTIYNEAVREFRRANRIRSRNHPVPELVSDADGYELPLWIWTAENPNRRRLFVRQTGTTTVLSDRAGWTLELPLSAEGDASRAVEVLADAARRGVKIRTRALTTTLWARLFLGDLFVHGIGGAKYDQLTDLLIERMFGLEPPSYAALSATLLLPVARPGVSEDDLRRIDGQLRELVYHPERSLDLAAIPLVEQSRAAEVLETKRIWIDTPPTTANARLRTRAIRAANESLQPDVAPTRELLLSERQETIRARQIESVLGSREYSVLLYPAKILRDFLLAIQP